MEKRLLHSLAFLLCVLFSMAQGRFCVGMLHYEVLSETGRVVHVYDSSFPWKEAVSVDIPETVSYNGKDYTVIAIGANAFASCCSLQAIKIPNSVTKIGKYAFWGCDSLRTVRIPNSVTVIGDGAFAGCRSLSAVGIPNSVTEIGREAFEGCHSLRTVRIPSSVAKIGDRAFFNCRSLQSITVDAGNAKYKSINGVLFNREATLLMSYPLGKKQQVYKIPNGVKVIGEHAFRNNSYLREVMMSDSVTTIGLYAFSNCRSLRKVSMQNSVDSIGNYVFENCVSLQEIEIPRSVRAIGNCPFRGCTALQAIHVASGNARYKSVDGVLFDHKGSLLKTYPEGRKQKTYTVPYSASMIECFAFENCKLLEAVQIPGSVVEIGAAAFSGCSALKEVSLPNSVTEINEFVFENCTSFREFIIPRSVTKIGNFAFSDCRSLRKIQIPESVTQIGKGAFSYCCSLQEVINLADEPQEIVHPVLGHAHIFAPETLQSARLFVKPSNLEKFKSTGGWKEFRTIVSY